MKIICGLGNPGEAYQGTRHNIGFRVLAALADKLGVEFSKSRFKSRMAEAAFGKEKLILLKPKTYMNLSGDAVAAAAHFLHIEPQEVLVVHDDMDLPVGTLRLRPKGGAGGHKGIQSVINELGSDDFVRLKIGIGRPPEGMDPTDYVLKRPAEAEVKVLESAAQHAVEAVLMFLEEGLSRTMNVFNRSSENMGEAETGSLDKGAQQ